MTEAATKLLAAALDLCEQDRLSLAEELMASVEPADPARASDDPHYLAWLVEIEDRAQKALEGHPGESWPAVRRKVEEQLGHR